VKYAKEVMELMAPFPGREFRMAEIVRYAAPNADRVERMRVHKGVLRVLSNLIESGSVIHLTPAAGRGDISMYAWGQDRPSMHSPELRHQVMAN
jgi:hypothetical protein